MSREKGGAQMAYMIPKKRRPTHPGKILEKDFLEPLEMTQTELAERLSVQFKRVNEIINQRRRVTPETAVLLAKVFGTSPQYWLNLQVAYDLYEVEHGEKAGRLKRVRPIEVERRRGPQHAA